MRLTITLLLFFVTLMVLSTGSVLAECVTTDCHVTLAKAASVHDPVAGGECESCHEATGLPHPGKDIGFVFPELGNALCLMCHDDPTAGQAHVHPALEDGCTACHNPHAGPADKMLPASGPSYNFV